MQNCSKQINTNFTYECHCIRTYWSVKYRRKDFTQTAKSVVMAAYAW